MTPRPVSIPSAVVATTTVTRTQWSRLPVEPWSASRRDPRQYEALRDDAERIAERFTDVFRAHMGEPFVEAGMPAERITEMINASRSSAPSPKAAS